MEHLKILKNRQLIGIRMEIFGARAKSTSLTAFTHDNNLK
jgi:hypothetical protein